MRVAAALRALVASALVPVLLLPAAAGAQVRPGDDADGEVRPHVVESFDGTPIVLDLHLPPGAGADAPVPVVLAGHGWGLTREQALGSTTDRLLAEGWAVLAWDARGFGQSGGVVQVDAPEVEGRDVQALIDWVAAQPEIALEAPGDPLLGMVGASYGGGIQLATATFDRRVDAIAPEITWHDLNRALHPQGVLKLVWLSALFGLGLTTGTVAGLDPRGPAFPQTGAYPPELQQSLQESVAQNEFGPEVTAFYAARSYREYGPTGRLDVPTLLLQGSVDTLFTIDEAADTFAELRGRGVPAKLVVFCGSLSDAASDDGAVTHGECPRSYAPAGDRARMDDLIVRWFDRWILDRPVDTGPAVEYRTNTGDWHRADAWPPPGTRTVEVPIAGSAVSPSTPSDGAGIFATAAPPGAPTAVTASAAPRELDGRQLEVVGQPQLRLAVAGTGQGAHLYARLVDPSVDQLPGAGSAVNQQETPLRVGPLSGEGVEVALPMVSAAYTLAPGAPLTVQVDTQSAMSTTPRTGPAQVALEGSASVPVRTLVADRVGGPDRVATAAELSRDSVVAADTVVLATALDYPDALAGAPLARALGAPLLLTGRDGLADPARREVLRTGATQAVLLGGEAVLGPAVAADLEALGLAVRRVAGDDRFATAAAVAAELAALGTGATTAYLVEGADADPSRGWPDAVTAGAPAARTGAPVLLAETDRLPEATLEALAAGGVTDVIVVGGEAAVSAAVAQQVADAGYAVTRFAGPDRYATSAAVAAAFPSARTVVAATGRDWPDALAAAPAAAAWDAALVLVDGDDLRRSAATLEVVEATAFDRLVVAGLESAVDEATAGQLAAAADRGALPATGAGR
jgi:ABC-2 type transport system ATP-binding protein